MHSRETTKTSNTGRLALLALPNSELRIRGEIGKTMATEGLLPVEYRSYLLLPSEDATELTPELVQTSGKPIHLIVPDGTWNQARKVATREPGLSSVPRIKLPAGGEPSEYFLRRPPNSESLSTFEAISRALGIIEGAEIRAKLDRLFAVVIERSLWSRGKLRMSECRFPIPQAALDAFHMDGCAGSRRQNTDY